MLPGFRSCSDGDCAGCAGGYLCHCFKITEQVVEEAIAAGACTLGELCQRTGAGGGCTACRGRLIVHLERARDTGRRLTPLAVAP